MAIEDALRRAIELCEAITKSEAGSIGMSALEYTRIWFEWSALAGLGRFCPITKILFRTRAPNKITLELLRAVRSDWRARLEAHIQNDPSINIHGDRFQNAVDEVLGVYFARQLAMQADGGQSGGIGAVDRDGRRKSQTEVSA